MFKLFSSKEKKEKPKLRGPQYIYKPFENALSYRVEHREDKSYVYPGWSKSFLYIIEGDKMFRAGEDEPFYIIIGKIAKKQARRHRRRAVCLFYCVKRKG